MTISDIAGRQISTAMGSMWACRSSLYMATTTTPPAQTTCLQSMSCRPASLSTTLERRCCSGTTTHGAWHPTLCGTKTDPDRRGLLQGQDIWYSSEPCTAAYSSIGAMKYVGHCREKLGNMGAVMVPVIDVLSARTCPQGPQWAL